MRAVWKLALPVNVMSVSVTNSFPLSVGARFLHCREQGNMLAMWFEVETDAPTESRGFQIFGTGMGPIREGLEYVGTGFFGSLVLHVYEDMMR